MKNKFAVVGLFLCSTFLMGMGSVQDMVRSEAIRQGVPVGLALAVAKHESGFKCHVIGRAGERGVMQIKPSTARGIGYKGPASGLSHCATGIRYGMMYLKMAYKKAKGSVYKTALLYNGGLGSNRKKSAYADKIHQKAR
jgi:soluble lytic murein transglycosylase-like protein